MKKLLCLTLTAVLAAALAAPAFAEDAAPADKTLDSGHLSDTTKVEFSVQPTYTVTIPDKVTLDKNDSNGTITYEKDLTVTANNVRLNEKKELKVSLLSNYELSVDSTVLTYKLPYTVTANKGTTIEKSVKDGSNECARFVTKTGDQSVTLHFAANNPTYAGDYSDTVTFTLAVVDATQTVTGGNG